MHPLASALVPLLVMLIAMCVALILAWNAWLTYIQTVFLRAQKWALLELKPPKEVYKSPAAMELVLNALHAGGPGDDFVAKYWKGEVHLWSSLEIVSVEGRVHFYVWIPEKQKKQFSTQVYAQYPQAEVVEVEDYVKRVPEYAQDGSFNLWGSMLVLSKDDALPIRTYIDYGLDRAVGSLDEEQRIDPITPLLEFLGSLGATEQAWMQILIRQDTKRFKIKNKEGKMEAGKGWTDRAKELIKEQNAKLVEKDAEGKSTARRATRGESALIEAIERNAGKYAFDTAIRLIYLADKDKFNAGAGGAFVAATKQFNNPDSNGFKGDKATRVKFPWEDMFGTKVAGMKKRMLGAYKKRSFFYGGFDLKSLGKYFTHPSVSGGKPFILSTEELATVYHLPGLVAETPTVMRVEAKKHEPPANLPV